MEFQTTTNLNLLIYRHVRVCGRKSQQQQQQQQQQQILLLLLNCYQITTTRYSFTRYPDCFLFEHKQSHK
jgi:hypothetical protein